MLYLAFIGLVLCAFGTSFALYYDGLGLTGAEAEAWYRGNADQPDAAELLMEKSPRQLLEVAHFHLYTMPVLLLVLGHLFLLARGSTRFKLGIVLGAAGFTALHVAAPWAVRYGAPGALMGLTGVPFMALYLTMALWPIPDLLSRDQGRASPGAGRSSHGEARPDGQDPHG